MQRLALAIMLAAIVIVFGIFALAYYGYVEFSFVRFLGTIAVLVGIIFVCSFFGGPSRSGRG